MSKVLSGVLSLGWGLLLVAGAATAAPAEQVTKDAKGRVTSRTQENADRSSHRTSIVYGSDSARPSVVVDEDLDPLRRPTRRVEQRFDEQGRLHEKVDVTIDAAGKERGTRTTYRYDASGQRLEEATPIR